MKCGVKQVNVIKKAVAKIGITYQTYVKHVLYQQALEAWKNLSIGPINKKMKRSTNAITEIDT